MDEENLTEEEIAERAEEKKKMDMMKKFYRNRYTSFIKTLAEQKAKKEEEQKEKLSAALKQKEKIKAKAVDPVNIQSKLMQPKKELPEEELPSFVPQLHPPMK